MAAKPRPCKRWQAEISAERVEAIPGTQFCVKCSSEVGGDFAYSFANENIGKAGSLKKNYCSINLSKSRRKVDPRGG